MTPDFYITPCGQIDRDKHRAFAVADFNGLQRRRVARVSLVPPMPPTSAPAVPLWVGTL